MTQNQIAYARFLEERRHNQETEQNARDVLKETNRHNVSVEEETAEHNAAQEQYWRESNAINANHYATMDAENKRHNMVTEANSSANIQELIRHNIVQESLTQQTVAETSRHNKKSESLEGDMLDIHQQNANTNALNATINQQNADTNKLRVDSEVALNNVRTQDVQSQMWHRPISVVTEAYKDTTIGVKNSVDSLRGAMDSINALSKIIKLFE